MVMVMATKIKSTKSLSFYHRLESTLIYRTVKADHIRILPCWYAVCTRSHHEKEVYRKMQELGISAYLPIYTTFRQWSDRKKKVYVPLFSCYVFVHITNSDYYRVLNIPGVIRYVTFESKAVPIPDKQIQMVKNLLEQDIEIEEVEDKLYNGAKVEITAYPLIGVCGELIDFTGKKRVIIRLDELRKSIVISLPIHLLRLIN